VAVERPPVRPQTLAEYPAVDTSPVLAEEDLSTAPSGVFHVTPRAGLAVQGEDTSACEKIGHYRYI